MRKAKVAELEHLTECERETLVAINDYVKSKGITVRTVLIGSKARGDYKPESDVDVMALYSDEIGYIGQQIFDYVVEICATNGVVISYMLFPEDIEYCDEEEAKEEYGAYYWIPQAIEKDGIRVRF